MPHSCAFGCSDKGAVLHVFPNPEKYPDRFKVWVELVSGKLDTPTDFKFYKKKRICDVHFRKEHKNSNKRLNAVAVPTLRLLGTSTVQDFAPVTDIEPTFNSAASTSGTSSAQHVAPRLDYQHPFYSAASMRVTPVTQQSEVPTINNATTAESSVLAEHNYSLKSRSKRKTLNEGSNKREVQLKVKKLQIEVNRWRKKELSYEHRLAEAHQMSNNDAYQTVVRHMTKPAQLFVNMQKQSIKKPKGRRYSLKEKILALSLYKKSPKCYKLLCEYFSLPSGKAMKRLLGEIKLTSGINTIIFQEIKKTMAAKEPADRLCSLIFAKCLLRTKSIISPIKTN